MADKRIPLDAARYNDTGSMIARSNTRGRRRRKGTTSYEFAEDGIHSEVLLESGGPERADTAIARYKRTGKHLGKFSTPRAASDYAHSLEDRDTLSKGYRSK